MAGMMRYRALIAIVGGLVSLPHAASADVGSVSDTGFVVTHSIAIAAPPASVYARLGEPARWWNSSHTYSGDAGNLAMTLRAGGCFCETIPAESATIEHARVIYAAPGKRLRLSGGLGPLQSEAVSATLDFALSADGSGGTKVSLTYVVGGFVRGGAAALSGPVDRVLGEQLSGLAKSFMPR